jgi:hypothetical protein
VAHIHKAKDEKGFSIGPIELLAAALQHNAHDLRTLKDGVLLLL